MKLKLSLTATPSEKKLYPKYTTWKSDIRDAASHVIATELPEITSSVVSVIFQTDDELLELNKRILDHDYYTDIITFPLHEPGDRALEGDIYISSERVTDNAGSQGVSFFHELQRVMAHGVLHMAGYGDETDEEESTMRAKEDFYLEKRPVKS